MAFSEVFGQDVAIDYLKKSIQHQQLPPAFLFAGAHHIGKQKTLQALAQTLNCSQAGVPIGGVDACGKCDSCLQIAHQSFPDFSIIEPAGQFLRIDQIKEALKWLELRSAAGSYRVLGLVEAEKMNKESANAFLKTLEEPPPQTVIVLLAEHPQQLLETLVSRCRLIRFRLLKKKHILEILHRYESLTEDQILFLSRFAMGRVRPDWVAKVELLQDMRETVIALLNTLSVEWMEEIFNTLEKWSAAKEKDWSYMLDLLEFWFRDLEWLAHGLQEEHLFNQDRPEQLRHCLQRFSLSNIRFAYNQVLLTRQRIMLNAHVSLALEALWIYFKRNLTK